MAKPSPEDAKTQYNKMIEEFKKGVLAMFDQSKAGMEELEKQANTNFEGMSTAYNKGCGDMKTQILKGNQSIIEKFTTNYKAIQAGLDEGISTLKGQDMSQFSSNVTKFTDAYDSTLKNNPTIKMAADMGSDAIGKTLEQKKKQLLESSQTKYAEATRAMRESAEDTVKKLALRMEDLSPKKK